MTTLKSNLLKKGKKGFTLTELAIVIAVIAILIAVLVPTFSSIITKAKVSNESVACKNEWTNFYIDADIAASGTDADYLVVYTDNSYSDSNGTYYHGYLATAGVYDTETQYDVTISSSNIATCGSVSYMPIGSYEYMAEGKITIYTYSTSTDQVTVTTADSFSGINTLNENKAYTIDNSGLTITGYNNTFYVTGTLSANKDAAQNIWGSDSDYPDSIFYIRVYYPLANSKIGLITKVDYYTGSNTTKNSDIYKYWVCDSSLTLSSWTDDGKTYNPRTESALDSSSSDAYAYTDFTLNGEYSKFVIKYYTGTSSSDLTLAGTITIYNNASQPSTSSN